MKQSTFEARHSAFWLQLEKELTRGKHQQPGPDFPARYRQLCQHLAVAKDRHYTPVLIERLNRIALDGHRVLYQRRRGALAASIEFAAGGFAALVRKRWRSFALANLLFYGPFAGLALWCLLDPEAIYSVMGFDAVANMESMYAPDNDRIGTDRNADSDFQMFGYYIMNNIGIGFRMFAGGMLAGVGTLFYLIFNGVHIGAVTGHLTRLEYTDTFFSFVITHGAFELTALVLAGMAGLMLGHAMLWPGRLSRGTALRIAGLDAARIMFGVFVMLLFAAFVEAFWSSDRSIASPVKYAVGGLCWALVAAYFLFAGRRRAA